MTETREDEVALNRAKYGDRATKGKGPASPAPPPIPRITRLMALAIRFQGMIDRGEVRDYADLARLGYVTRARITQIMNLLNLAPRIHERLLHCDVDSASAVMTERHLRAVAAIVCWADQEAALGLRGHNGPASLPSR